MYQLVITINGLGPERVVYAKTGRIQIMLHGPEYLELCVETNEEDEVKSFMLGFKRNFHSFLEKGTNLSPIGINADPIKVLWLMSSLDEWTALSHPYYTSCSLIRKPIIALSTVFTTLN